MRSKPKREEMTLEHVNSVSDHNKHTVITFKDTPESNIYLVCLCST